MRYHADLHIHSKYSRACSKDGDLPHLAWWARRKGVTVVGTGDFTHPAWFDHLRDNLVPAEPGLLRLRDEVDRDVAATLPSRLAAAPVRFMLSVEISTIYKRDERTRKIHHLVYVPDLDTAARFNERLGRIGNLGADGRPILGLDSRDLLEITLESGEGAYLVPAHAWTPWFAVLGSKSGFDAVDDCYGDLAGHVFAVETGLSSDPPMNWRVSSLDRFRLMSSSDAHSPPIVGRETTVFDTDLDYFALRRALETGEGHAGTVEFFPEEGKYHVDGHRACGVRMEPHETRRHGGSCPVCGSAVTVGVLNRVEQLADRDEGTRPEGAAGYTNLVPLPEIVGEVLGAGPKSKKVVREIDGLVATLGPELAILEDVPVDDIATHSPLLAEAVTRLRRGDVHRQAGYDGEYGVIRLFEPDELRKLRAADAPPLFEEGLYAVAAEPAAPPWAAASAAPVSASPASQVGAAGPAAASAGEAPDPSSPSTPPSTTPSTTPSPAAPSAPSSPAEGAAGAGGGLATAAAGPAAPASPLDRLHRLDPDQRAAAAAVDGPLLIVAGPGTGKTRTLTHRIAHLVTAHGVRPEQCLVLTFTRRAAEELTERLADLLPDQAERVTAGTFHALGVGLLREHHERVGLGPRFGIADRARQLDLLAELTGADPGPRGERAERDLRRMLDRLSALRRSGGQPATSPGDRGGTGEAGGPEDSPGAGEAGGTGAAGAADIELAELAGRYVKALRQQDLVDLDDLIALPVALLEGDPELAAALRDRYRWVAVDEYQDVDDLQYRLLRRLVPPGGNLTAIGDPDQSIYGFRGADVGFFLRFRQDHPDARVVQLTRNYRSSAPIVSAARQLVAPVSLVPDRALWAMGNHGDARVGIHHAANERAEAAFVARTVDQLLGGTSFHSLDTGRVGTAGRGAEGLGLSDIAVLYRTDRQARTVVTALTLAGLPCQKRSHDRLADRPGVEWILAELDGDPAEPAAAGAPASDDPDAASAASAAGAGGDPGDRDVPVEERVRRAAAAIVDRLPPAERQDAAAELNAAVDLLGPLARRCGHDLARFRTDLALGVEVDAWDPRADRISLLTLHAAKGLEFPVVFVVGCEDGLLPLRWSGGPEPDAAQLAEERRLLFVGMTRAQRHLFLSYTAERARPGGARRSRRSPFLADVDLAACQQIGDRVPRRGPRSTQLRLM